MCSSGSDGPSVRRVSPFGDLRFFACLRLPVDYRSLPRPSSALGAWASALCSSSLDFYNAGSRLHLFLTIVNPETNFSFRIVSDALAMRLRASRNWPSKPFSLRSSLVLPLCGCQGAHGLACAWPSQCPETLKAIQMEKRDGCPLLCLRRLFRGPAPGLRLAALFPFPIPRASPGNGSTWKLARASLPRPVSLERR